MLAGLAAIVSRRPDPYFAYGDWAEAEAALGLASAFYLHVKPTGVPGHVHNPSYWLGRGRKWQLLKDLVRQGWEIGLHSSIRALEADAYVAAEKRMLEEFLDAPVAGNRAHYWSLDWQQPDQSFARLETAGFIYDMSMAWKDMPGFRAGTCLPYHPFDASSNRACHLLEIPSTVMDGHLFEYNAEVDPHQLFAAILHEVRRRGGILVLDWHERTWVDRYSYQGWRSFLMMELASVVETGEAWFATPEALARNWLARERQLTLTGLAPA